VAVRKCLNVDAAGDETDHRQFIGMCAHLPLALRQLNLNPEEIWTRAQQAVDEELENEDLRVRLMGKADEYLKKLYQL
jgi:hypothetical protein